MGGALSAARARRTAEREQLLRRAADHVEHLQTVIDVEAAAVIGSVARGDFNAWSDIDLLVVAPDLPAGPLDRLALLAGPPGLHVWAFEPAELAMAIRRRNAAVLDLAAGRGVVLLGAPRLAELVGGRGHHDPPT